MMGHPSVFWPNKGLLSRSQADTLLSENLVATEVSVAPAPEPAQAKSAQRMVSLDFFRGITIAAMILVNNPGNGHAYAPLEHAEWNGWTPTDLIFPFFLFIVGVSLVLSFASRLGRGATRTQLLRHSLQRAAIIFVIGVALNAFPYNFWPIRFPGVLQRIAIAYAVAAVIALWTTTTRSRLLIAGSLIVGYWVLMRYVPVPGLGIPGRDIPFLDPNRNLAAWIDRLIIPGHLYETTRDPEGLLSTLPSVATVLLGIITGGWLKSDRSPARKAAGMLAFGALGLALGKIFDVVMPINKNLWTSSFVVFTAGFALVVLAACYWLLDVKQWRGWWATPFVAFGANAIAIYTSSMLVAKSFNRIHLQYDGQLVNLHEYINERFFAPLANPSMASLLYSLTFVALAAALALVLYRKRIFFKV